MPADRELGSPSQTKSQLLFLLVSVKSHQALLRGCSVCESPQLPNRACMRRATCSSLEHWNPWPAITFLGISSRHFHCTSPKISKFDMKPNSEIRSPDWQRSGAAAAAAVFHTLVLNELLQSIYFRKTHIQMQECRVAEPSIPHPSLPVQWALSQSSSSRSWQAQGLLEDEGCSAQ